MRTLASFFIGVLSLVALADAAAASDRPVRSPQVACEILKLGAVEHRLSVQDLTGRYYCDYVEPPIVRGGYYLLGLRYRAKPQERIGSDLIGWFVVRVHDGELLEY